MPRKFLKKWTPDPEKLKARRHLRLLGDTLHASFLWQFNRGNVAKACAIGIFCMWIPVPSQMLLAAIGAVYFRANLPVSVALVFVSNPLTTPAMSYFCYKLGAIILGIPAREFNFELSIDWLANGMLLVWKPFLLGVSLVAVVSSVVAYYGALLLWRLHIIQKLRSSRALRLRRRQ
ncbi:MAG: DUF2062 domain-containing protein [Geobacteraceae bacterium]|nr:DUF2062 domain-containing protein [Geobacteraceae bacterium]